MLLDLADSFLGTRVEKRHLETRLIGVREVSPIRDMKASPIGALGFWPYGRGAWAPPTGVRQSGRRVDRDSVGRFAHESGAVVV